MFISTAYARDEPGPNGQPLALRCRSPPPPLVAAACPIPAFWNCLDAGRVLTVLLTILVAHPFISVVYANTTYCWGDGEFGTLGNGLGTGMPYAWPLPTPVVDAPSFASVSAGFLHSCAITAAGKAYCWVSCRACRIWHLGACWVPGNEASCKCGHPNSFFPSSCLPAGARVVWRTGHRG